MPIRAFKIWDKVKKEYVKYDKMTLLITSYDTHEIKLIDSVRYEIHAIN